MGRVGEIKKIISQAKELVEECKKDLVEKVEEYNISLDEFQRQKEIIKTSTIDDVEEVLDEIDNLPENPYQVEVVEEDMERLEPVEIPEVYEVEEPISGFFKAKFFGFIAFLLSLLAFLTVALVMKRYDLTALNLQNWQKYIEDGFNFYSSLLLQTSDTSPIVGGIVITALSFAVGYLVYFIVVHSAASKNLQRAREIFEEAKEWVERQKEFIERLKERISFLKDTNHTLEGLRIFGEEFASRGKRDIFFEGRDFEGFSQIAKDEILSLQKLDLELNTAAKLELYVEGDDIASVVKSRIDEMKELINSLKAKIYG